MSVKNIWKYTAREEKMREVKKDRSRNTITDDKKKNDTRARLSKRPTFS